MAYFDLLIKNGRVVLENGVFAADLGITAGKIAAILAPQISSDAAEIIDAQGQVILPGAVDAHFHSCEPGPYAYREYFDTGTAAAAAGGITTVIDMPLTVPSADTPENFAAKAQIAKRKAIIDWALWGAFIPNSFPHLRQLHELGCPAFKAFMPTATDTYPHVTDRQMLEGMRRLAEFGGLLGVHAENREMIDEACRMLEAEGNMDPLAHEASRPIIAELEAIQRALLFAEHTGCRTHICHMSIAEGEKLVRQAKDKGLEITVETCPHYLIFDLDDLQRSGMYAKCNPPLRSRTNVEALWELVLEGRIDMIGSDHSPYTNDDRERCGDNIWQAPPGIGGVAAFIPALVDEGIHRRGMSWELLARLTATNPAKIFGLYPQKGSIRLGADADLCLVDPSAEWVYQGVQQLSAAKCDRTPYEGRRMKGQVIRTMVRGKTVVAGGQVQVSPGYGSMISPIPSNKAK